MKITDFKGEEALDLLVNIMEPVTIIFADKAVRDAYKSQPKLQLVKTVVKSHMAEVLEIMAMLNGMSADEYKAAITIPGLIRQVLELINDKELQSFLESQAAETESTASGLPTENTTVEKTSRDS
jgi:hypothetical protein|nr:MAG TPA: hypothetical protein [Caudoviricetes sp.]